MLHTRTNPRSGVTLLLLGAAVTVVLGLLATVLGGLVSGAAAALEVLVGTGLVVVVCTLGAILVTAVARVSPAASLLVALMTYTLQVVLLLVAFVLLERSGLLGAELHRGWLGGAVIGATVLWLVTQVTLVTTARIPAYDLRAEVDGA